MKEIIENSSKFDERDDVVNHDGEKGKSDEIGEENLDEMLSNWFNLI